MHKETTSPAPMSSTDNNLRTGFVGSPMLPFLNDDPSLDAGQPLDQLVWDQLEQSPNKAAIIDGARTLTYAQLRAHAEGVARGLLARGRQPGDRVLLHLENGLAFAEALLGTLLAGCVPVLTLPGHRFAELSHLAQLSGAAELVGTDKALLDEVAASCDVSVVHVGGLPITEGTDRGDAGADAAEWHPGFVPDNPAVLLVSGGTTGLPKLIARTHQDYRYDIACAAAACTITADDVYLAALPLAHNFPLASPGLFGVLAAGGTVVCAPIPSPDMVFDLIEQHRVTIVSAVPSLALLWAEATEWETQDLSSLRLVQVGGARFSPEQAVIVDEAFNNTLQQVFGMAEGLLCFTTPGDPDRDRVRTTQGYPMSPLDKLRIGADGGLETSGPYTILGYYRAPAANEASFTDDGWYRSGDNVHIHDDGSVVVMGRIKDVVIKAGENVDCVELEEVLSQVPGVANVVVVGAPDEYLGEAVVAGIVAQPGSQIDLELLRAAVHDAGMADFKQPDRLLMMNRVPLTAVGKPDRKVVAEWAREA